MLNKLSKHHVAQRLKPISFEKPKSDIIELYIKLVGGPIRGTSEVKMVRCCFHEEKTPSLALYPKTSSYYCFACSKHGDAINFVEEVLHCNFSEALEYLKQNGR